MDKLLQGWAAAQAEIEPDAIAVVYDGERWTYGELEARSNQIARALLEGGAKRGDRIALLAPKSIEAIAGMLGALKAGCAYAPLEPRGRLQRTAEAINRCECTVALAGDGSAGPLSRLHQEGLLRKPLRIGWLGGLPEETGFESLFSGNEIQKLPRGFSHRGGSEDDLAQIVFQSGAGGELEGVMIQHKSVVRYVDWVVRMFGLGADERLSGHSPLSFDLSTQDIYSAFAAGAELHLAPPKVSLSPKRLAQFIRESRLTQWFSAPSLLAYMARNDALEQDDFPLLRRLAWAGETFAPAALAYWMRKLPHVSFWNLYGPSETTIASCYYRVPGPPAAPAAGLPIGRPCEGERIYVLDRQMRPLAPGQTGELYISGAGVSPGYWGDDARTSRAFLANPFPEDPSPRIYRTGDVGCLGEDGLFYLLGRSDGRRESLPPPAA
jgi:amino acid adenylation domain-containing protein